MTRVKIVVCVAGFVTNSEDNLIDFIECGSEILCPRADLKGENEQLKLIILV